jgi:hypothetical protein
MCTNFTCRHAGSREIIIIKVAEIDGRQRHVAVGVVVMLEFHSGVREIFDIDVLENSAQTAIRGPACVTNEFTTLSRGRNKLLGFDLWFIVGDLNRVPS